MPYVRSKQDKNNNKQPLPRVRTRAIEVQKREKTILYVPIGHGTTTPTCMSSNAIYMDLTRDTMNLMEEYYTKYFVRCCLVISVHINIVEVLAINMPVDMDLVYVGLNDMVVRCGNN